MAVCLYAHQFVTENNKKSNFAQQPPKPSNHGWFGFKKNHCFDLLIEFTWLKRTLWILKFRRCRCPFPQEKLSIFHILGKPIPWTYKGKLFDTCFLPQFVFFLPFPVHTDSMRFLLSKHGNWSFSCGPLLMDLMDSEMELVMALPNWPVAWSCEMKLRGDDLQNRKKCSCYTDRLYRNTSAGYIYTSCWGPL